MNQHSFKVSTLRDRDSGGDRGGSSGSTKCVCVWGGGGPVMC